MIASLKARKGLCSAISIGDTEIAIIAESEELLKVVGDAIWKSQKHPGRFDPKKNQEIVAFKLSDLTPHL